MAFYHQFKNQHRTAQDDTVYTIRLQIIGGLVTFYFYPQGAAKPNSGFIVQMCQEISKLAQAANKLMLFVSNSSTTQSIHEKLCHTSAAEANVPHLHIKLAETTLTPNQLAEFFSTMLKAQDQNQTGHDFFDAAEVTEIIAKYNIYYENFLGSKAEAQWLKRSALTAAEQQVYNTQMERQKRMMSSSGSSSSDSRQPTGLREAGTFREKGASQTEDEGLFSRSFAKNLIRGLNS